LTKSCPELLLIRHAPSDADGRLSGRRDIPALPIPPARLKRLRQAVASVERRLSSPALRCRETAAALWPGHDVSTDPRLLEQDFGAWEGLRLSEVPDLGPLDTEELARHRPPGGESFEDVCARVWPALDALGLAGTSTVAIVHAGTIRAALGRACGFPGAGLVFEVSPLSLTRLRPTTDGFAVISTNWLAG
jgi:alpha-ribazole phosphatase